MMYVPEVKHIPTVPCEIRVSGKDLGALALELTGKRIIYMHVGGKRANPDYWASIAPYTENNETKAALAFPVDDTPVVFFSKGKRTYAKCACQGFPFKEDSVIHLGISNDGINLFSDEDAIDHSRFVGINNPEATVKMNDAYAVYKHNG